MTVFRHAIAAWTPCQRAAIGKEVDAISLESDTAVERLAKLTYLIEHDNAFLRDCRDRRIYPIDEAFSRHLDEIDDRCKTIRHLYKKAGLPHRREATAVEMIRCIAEALITRHGDVNVGLVLPYSRHIEASTKNISDNISVTIRARLHTLLTSRSIQHLLRNTDNPNTLSSPGALTLKAALGKDIHAPFEAHDAKKGLITAFLTHIRQTPSDSCFSLVICLAEMTTNSRRALKELRHLITQSKVRRRNHSDLEFLPLLTHMPNKSLDAPLSKKILSREIPLVTLPPFAKAFAAIGRTGGPKTMPQGTLTARNILNVTANEATRSDQKRDSLFNRAAFIFESETTSPITTIWSNSVAAMAETPLNSMLKSRVLNSILCALNINYLHLPNESVYLKTELGIAITNVVLSTIHFAYDPFLSGSRHYTGPLTNDCGFVIYEKRGASLTRIDHQEAFCDMVADVIRQAGERTALAIRQDSEYMLLKKMVAILLDFLYSSQFVPHLLAAYKKAIHEPVLALGEAPWITRSGNDTESTLEVYHDKSQLKKAVLYPASAAHLLELLIDTCRKMRHETPHFFKRSMLIPARLYDVHAFNMTLGHRSLKAALNSSLAAKEWVERLIVQDGLRSSRIRLHTETMKRIIHRLQRYLPSTPHIENSMACHHFINHLADALHMHSNAKRLIFDNLPVKLKQKLFANSLHIADSNWQENGHDLHFAIVYSPLSLEPELWLVSEDHSIARPLEQSEWIADQIWEIFLI